MLLWQALCLILVVEGAALVLFPHHLKEAAVFLLEADSQTLRIIGLVALLLGASLLMLL